MENRTWIHWSPEDLETLHHYWSIETPGQIGERLGRTEMSIRAYAWRLGLRRQATTKPSHLLEVIHGMPGILEGQPFSIDDVCVAVSRSKLLRYFSLRGDRTVLDSRKVMCALINDNNGLVKQGFIKSYRPGSALYVYCHREIKMGDHPTQVPVSQPFLNKEQS